MRLYKLLGSIHLSLTILLVGCAGGVDPMEDPIQPSEELNDNANENMNENGNNANADNDENLENNENLGNENDALVNNAAGENFLNEAEGGNNLGNNELGNSNNEGGMFENDNGTGPGENGANTELGDDAIIENGAEDNIVVDGEAIPGNNSNQTSPNIEVGATDSTVAGDRSGGSKAVPSSGVVRYVVTSGTSGLDSPNGKSVKSLEQGDHPLISDGGEWSRTSDGLYISSSSLTARPVPRAKTRKDWR